MLHPTVRTLRNSAVPAALASLLLAPSLTARAASTRPPESAVTSASTVLKHLPAGHDELVFRGESVRKSWPLFVGRNEIERAKVFQLALKNTVALMPDRSSLRLAINGHLLATVPTRAPAGLAVVSVAIPPGVLVPGFNTVAVSAQMTHRVDCSVGATYELWSLLDPAQTGLVLAAAPNAGIRSIEDLSAIALADDGTTRITLRSAETADAAAVGRAARFIDALVERAGLVRPVVRVAPGGGQGSGFDVVLVAGGARDGGSAALTIQGRDSGLVFARDPVTGRSVLILSGVDDADLDRQISAFAAPRSRLSPASPAGQVIVDGETRRSFDSLGLSTDAFAGRHYGAALDVVLPSDFYPANYDKAQLQIDGTYAGSLDRDNDLVFRVNGALVSSLRLGPNRGGVLQHEAVELPLRFFHPGHNEVALEAVTSTPADRQCDTVKMVNDVRFTLAGTSEIAFPSFAHLSTIPQIPGALDGTDRGSDGAKVDLYLAQSDAESVGSGLTVLANRAVGRHDAIAATVHLGPPTSQDAPGIVLGAFDSLPADLRADVRARTAADEVVPADPAQGGVARRPDVATAPGLAEAPMGFDPQMLVVGLRHLLKQQGFFFGSDEDQSTVPVSPGSLVVAAVDPHAPDQRRTRLNLPRFATSTAQWLVFTAADAATLHDGLSRLVSDGQWGNLDGDVASLDPQTGRLVSLQPSHVLYVTPDHLVLSDVRPILGGIVSNHIEISLVVLLLLMAILGLSTHGLIRRMGAK